MTQTTLDHPTGGLSAADWDQLAGPHFYSTARWLAYNAGSAPGRAGAAVATGADGAVAAVPLIEVADPLAGLYGWNDLLAARDLPRIPARGLMLGSTQGFQTHLLAPSGADRVEAAGTLVEEVRCVRGALGGADERACVAMYLATDDVRAAKVAGVRALPVLLDTDAWIDLPAGGWDAWLETFSYKRRVAIRRDARRFAEAGYVVTHGPLREHYASLGPLAMATNTKYGQSQNLEFYVGLLKAHVDGMGDLARVAVCSRPDGEPVGFCLYYVWDDTVFLRWAGFDYARIARAAEYFNLVYYVHIMAAPETGVRRIHAGIKATEAKALRGARLHPLWMLDVTGDSELVRHESAIREHNRRAAAAVLTNPVTAAAVGDHEEWTAYA